MNILEVNNIDLPGKRWNGYDLQEYINENTKHKALQIVMDKLSNNANVRQIITNRNTKNVKMYLESKQDEMSLKMAFLPFAYKFMQMSEFKEADLIHYHLVHNNMFSLSSLETLFKAKKSIWTIHDPWITTGHCIYPKKCENHKNGCKNCPHLDYIFPIKEDTAAVMWQYKKNVFEKIKDDIHLVVASKYMENIIKNSPITGCCKNIHRIPFGIDHKIFKPYKSSIREKFKIDEDNIVLFFRAQDTGVKGIEFIKEALKMLKTEKKVTLLTCNDKNLMDELKEKYQIIDYGWVNDDKEMADLYNASDIFLMPSTAEAFGVMAIEAMACEKPVIVFEKTSLPEVTFAPECGIAVEYENSKKLCKAIKELIDNETERIRRGQLGRKLCLEHYDINRYNKDIVKLYEKVYKTK